MKFLLMACLVVTSLLASAQSRQEKNIGLSFTNNNTAKPFQKFSSLFSDVLHPGFRVSYGFNWRTKQKHDWFQQFHAGYFYHRFVQHAIPLYTDFGYRYKILPAVHLSAAIGAGYMHSIPATAVLEADEEGNYSNAKGIGRPQAIATFTLEARYNFTAGTNKAALFFNYQQLLHTPFIKSYVPLLPYNAAAIGLAFYLKSENK